MFKPTFNATVLYKSGNKHTVRGMIDLSTKNGAYSWESGYREHIMLIGVDAIEAIYYNINPWYKNAFYAIWRKCK